MAFRGLFVGIDRYASPKINWLSCAKRDATALHALFSDTLGDGATLLTDEEATKAAIENEFKNLASCDKNDVVLLFFSGHGSETHELVTYDAVREKLAETALPLDTLTDYFSTIPATRLICILDCCFSGGMGAKVLKVDSVSRSLSSTTDLIDQLSGDGRMILTASRRDEAAWENGKIGHGLLTYYLLEALQGAEEVRQVGKVSIYRLLEYVSQRVQSDALQIGKIQHPTLKATLDDTLTWPVFIPGTKYLTAFPERKRIQVTKDISSLAQFGFPPALLNSWGGSITELNQLQVDAINEFDLLRGAHLVVSAPTSSGKTMIGELAALKGCLDRRRAFFLLPLKALVNDKYQQFTLTYSDFGIKTIRATGEITDDIPDLMRGQYDICLMTYEKFSALVLSSPYLLEQVGTVVVDEVQMLADESRGANLEFILTLLRMRRRQGIEPQLVTLSAVVGDTNGLERWLGSRLLLRKERPVPLDEGVLRADGTYRYLDAETGDEKIIPDYIQRQWGKGSSQDWIIPLVRKLVSEGKQVIVFREQRGETRGCALYLARELGLPAANEALSALSVGDLSGSSDDLRICLRGGVAFHNSNLDRDERLAIEAAFRVPDTKLRVIVATTTLAMGVNTPAEAVVVVGLQHPGAVPKAYSIAEYKNIIGRAGRLGYSNRGISFLLTLSDNEEHHAWNHFVSGRPENLISRFLADDTDVRSLIVRILAATQRLSKKGLTSEDVIAFLEGSFGAFQLAQEHHEWKWNTEQITQALANLEGHHLIEISEERTYKLTGLGWLAGASGTEVETITRLVDALQNVDPQNINEATLVAASQLSVELDAVFFPLNRKSVHKEPQFWSYQLREQNVAPQVMQAIIHTSTMPHRGTLRAKKAAACLLWMTDKPVVELEQILTQFGGATDGAAGPIRSVASRTCDILPVVARVSELLHPTISFGDRIDRLITRLQVGVPSSAVDLARQSGSRLSRADYLNLIRGGLIEIALIEVANEDAILACFGDSINKELKMAELRRSVRAFQERDMEELELISIIPPYES